MTPIAREALNRILILRKYPYPQSAVAEERILKTLNVPDFLEVVTALENKSVTRG